MDLTLPLVALAGIASFASPCFLPIVPVFVGYLVGTTPAGTVDRSASRRMALSQSSVFVLGFTTAFVVLWASIGVVGYALGDHRDLIRIIGGALLIVLGLHVSGLIALPFLDRTVRARMRVTSDDAPTYRRSALLGLAFGAGWTPCIGPILGGVIGLASAHDSVAEGAGLLLVYSLALGIPFILVSLGATEISARLSWFTRHEALVAMVSGGLLILTGFLMITNLFSRLAGLTPAFAV